ncbi:MAG: LysE family transporter [Verrucomicrobiota bacterium]
MFDLHPNALAALTGFLSGILLSIPVGPINLTIINEGARRGFFGAALIALGAISADLIYCTLAFTGFASFFQKGLVKAAMELISFVFLLYLGIRFLKSESVKATNKIEVRIEEKLHPHSAFMIGFVRVIGNPGILLFWIILAANFISREWVEPDGPAKFSCVFGVAMGASLWFLSLSYAVSRGHKKFTDKTLLRLEHFSGIGLITLALIHGARIIWQMAKHKM